MSRALAVRVGALAVLMTCALPARAQGDAAKLEQATRLYEEATKLLDAKDFDAACPKLEQAVQLIPVASGAQLALGACYEGKGRLGSAFRRYEEAAALARAAGQAEREQRAREALATLSPRVARLVVKPSAEARAAQGLVVRLEGAELASTAWDTPQPIDAGERSITTDASGRARLEVKITMRDGESRAIEVGLGAAEAPPPVAPPPPQPPASSTPSPAEEESGGGSPLRTVGLVLGGVGVAGLIVGAVTGGLAIGKKSDGDAGCVENRCPEASLAARDEGFTFATISTIGFVAGGALVAGGVVLFVVGGDDEGGASAAHLQTELRPGGLSVSGAF